MSQVQVPISKRSTCLKVVTSPYWKDSTKRLARICSYHRGSTDALSAPKFHIWWNSSTLLDSLHVHVQSFTCTFCFHKMDFIMQLDFFPCACGSDIEILYIIYRHTIYTNIIFHIWYTLLKHEPQFWILTRSQD